jgi:hypothetical protein
MNTTLLFVEVFIAGIQGLIWVALLALNLIGPDWLAEIKLQDLGGWTFLISALVFSFAYSLGIVIDRVANFLYSNWDKKIGAQYFPQEARSLAVVRFQLNNEHLNKQLEYVRTRLRIARSSSVNFLLITIFSIGLFTRLDFLSIAEKWSYSGIVGAIGVLFVVLFAASWYSLTKTNYHLIKQSTLEAQKNKPTSRKKNA